MLLKFDELRCNNEFKDVTHFIYNLQARKFA